MDKLDHVTYENWSLPDYKIGFRKNTSAVRGLQLFLGKKIQLYFFFPFGEKKIQFFLDLSEWVAFYFSGEKIKCGTFAQPKVPYFFFPRISSFLCIFGENRMNEWKSCFFFSGARKKKKQFWNRMNEWPTNLSAGKKKTENLPEIFWKRQKINLFFFSAFSEKKNTIFGFEWMNGQRTYPGKKKYGTFGSKIV